MSLLKVSSKGSGCDSVGKAFASDSRGPQFKSSHWQNLYWTFIYLFTIGCVEKTKINKKRPGMAHFLKKENPSKGGSPSLVVKGGDSLTEGCKFES